MSKESEILRKCVSSHVPKIKEIEGGHISQGVSVLQKVTLNALR